VAEAFLYRMVRSLVGALKRVGTGDWPAAHVPALLAARDRQQGPPLAPPHGLCLVDVLY
jgi:tRNA pseudouridine38-40 synthase